MLEAQLVVYDLIHLRTGPIGAQMPGDRAARLGCAAVVLSLAWFVGILDGRNRAIVIAESLARVIVAIRITSVRWRSHLPLKHRN